MLPLHDDNPTRSKPVVTIVLIAANLAVFLYQLANNLDVSVFLWGLIPAELTRGHEVLMRTGDPRFLRLLEARELDPWMTIFSSMFMHGSWLHILSNMWFLWLFGNNVEDVLGKGRYLLFYLFGGVAAAAAQVVLDPGSTIPMVGASGAVAGVLGGYLVIFPGSRVLCLITTIIITTIELPAWVVLGFWFVLNVFNQLVALGPTAPREGGGVAFAAHIGGFVVGYLILKLLGGRRLVDRHWQTPMPRRPDYMDWR